MRHAKCSRLCVALLFAPSLALADDTIAEKRPTNVVVHVDGAGALHGATHKHVGVTQTAMSF